MKKVIFLPLVSIMLFSCGDNKKAETEAPKNTDLLAQNLKGMVKSVEVTTYKADSTGKIGAMDSCCARTDEYDEKGYVLRNTSKDITGKITEEQTMVHYEKGQMKDMVTMADGKKKATLNIQIDKDGKYATAQSFDSTGKMDNYYTDLQENEYGAVTSGKVFGADSVLKYTFTNIHDKAIYMGGRTDSAGKLIYESKIKVNEKGDMVEMHSTNVTKDSTIHKTETYTYDQYDEQGNWTQRTLKDEKGKAVKIEKRVISYYKKD